MTAYRHPQSAVRLAVVSRDVQQWIEQVMYKEIWFVGEPSIHAFGGPSEDTRLSHIRRFLVAVDSRPAEFFVERVKTVHFSGYFDDEESICRVLLACSGLTNLGFHFRVLGETSPEVSRLIHTFPLEKLFVASDLLNHFLSQTPDTGSSIFSSTHLCVVSGKLQQSHLLSFPDLTHLAFLSDGEGDFAYPLKHALSQPGIKSVVIMISPRLHANPTTRAREVLKLHNINDPRIVIFTLPMAQKIFFDDDIWDLANEFPDEAEPLVERYLTSTPEPRILPFSAIRDL
ncbi:hypothetical protein BDZ94DRAFT_1251439 [Collybia nuda]|uniref:Uncharacterized protein n=1 Tax=Collybia nuda TaxID=64659 RepID=A0A9P6CN04_9AGAR|nr:hypothetical protein BDZ94DRAFT_1251439 [Collybia nuda]